MARSKRIFVSVYVTVGVVLVISAVLGLVSTPSDIGWWGSLVAAGTGMGYFGYLLVVGFPRTSATMPALTGPTLAGAAVAIASAALGGDPTPAGEAVVAAAGWLGYVFWYSRLDRAGAPLLQVGSKLPAFALVDTQGAAVASTSFIGQPTLLMFYRGNWCPLCMAQIREIAAQYRELADRDVKVALVSPQSQANTRKLAQRFDVPFDFLVDPENRAARDLGIAHEDGLPLGFEVLGYDAETVLPTVILTDAQGTILMADQTDNYRVRPEPATFLKALQEAPGSPAQGMTKTLI